MSSQIVLFIKQYYVNMVKILRFVHFGHSSASVPSIWYPETSHSYMNYQGVDYKHVLFSAQNEYKYLWCVIQFRTSLIHGFRSVHPL